MPWYEWHETIVDLQADFKRQDEENKKNGNGSGGGETYAQAKQMMKGATPKMPAMPKLK